jgi:hypothetical protein
MPATISRLRAWRNSRLIEARCKFASRSSRACARGGTSSPVNRAISRTALALPASAEPADSPVKMRNLRQIPAGSVMADQIPERGAERYVLKSEAIAFGDREVQRAFIGIAVARLRTMLRPGLHKAP